jgi:import inner membrane translocase subunit TIM50
VVVYTDEQNMYADPIINRLDPQRAVQYRLYRQDTQYVEGKHVRDLSKLNRDMGSVLFLSANPSAWSFQPENTIKLKAWTGETKDTTLLDLIPMLQMIFLTGVKDVRDVVKSYDGEEDVAKAFKTRMQQISEQHKQQQQKAAGGLFRLR